MVSNKKLIFFSSIIMLKPILKRFKLMFRKSEINNDVKSANIQSYIANNRVPWTLGYQEYKEQEIFNALNSENLLEDFKNKEKIRSNYGIGLDERIVEYPWALSNISESRGLLLDAGSVLNYDFCINHPRLSNKEITIATFAPENNCFYEKRISYNFCDLRNLPFKDKLFDEILCISTLEHIDMDNSIYGWNENNSATIDEKRSFEYLKVILELLRVLNNQGSLFVTFPFGKFENHGFFQQFDDEMLLRVEDLLTSFGEYEITFFRYTDKGWIFCSRQDCENIVSYNPHSGRGKGNDGAAHCRSICCIKFIKNK